MSTFEFNGNRFYIDGRLKTELDKKIVPDLQKKDKDAVFAVDGKERSGKSVFSMQIGGYIASVLETEFNLSNICMEPNEFRDKIKGSKKNQVVIYDEAHRGMASARALSEINQILKDLMMEMGQKNLFVIIVLPTIFLLDRYAALFRTQGLFHIYENKRRRGFWVFYNEKRKLTLYIRGKKEFNYNCMKYPGFRGRFYDKYAVDEQEYRLKKKKSFEKKERLSKAEKYKDERDEFIWILYKEANCKPPEILIFMKQYKIPLKKTQLYDILKEKRQKYDKASVSEG